MDLSENLKKLMESRGLNSSGLSQVSKVPASRISEIVTGKTKSPQIKTLQKLAAALGISVDDLTGGEIEGDSGTIETTPAKDELLELVLSMEKTPELLLLLNDLQGKTPDEVLDYIRGGRKALREKG